MMQTQTAQAEAFYLTPEFWVAVAFVIFVAVAGKALFRAISTALDDRSETIRKHLEEAQKLREDAQDMLASYQHKQRDAIDEAAAIIKHAEDEAQRIRTRAAEELDATLKRREAQALERIEQTEAKAMAQLRAQATDLALDATRRVIKDGLKTGKAKKVIDDAIGELGDKLH